MGALGLVAMASVAPAAARSLALVHDADEMRSLDALVCRVCGLLLLGIAMAWVRIFVGAASRRRSGAYGDDGAEEVEHDLAAVREVPASTAIAHHRPWRVFRFANGGPLINNVLEASAW